MVTLRNFLKSDFQSPEFQKEIIMPKNNKGWELKLIEGYMPDELTSAL